MEVYDPFILAAARAGPAPMLASISSTAPAIEPERWVNFSVTVESLLS